MLPDIDIIVKEVKKIEPDRNALLTPAQTVAKRPG
jgi:hypothetical protein